jgi:hypothetical protein
MFLVGIISWWYSAGWMGQLRRMFTQLTATASYFSIGQLFATLFAPFRQISAGRVNGSIAVQLRAFFDQTFSRVIGALVRLITILAGAIFLVVQLVVDVVIAITWLVLPALPVVGLILYVVGWVPVWT